MSVVGCTDLSGKELHRQVGMGKMVTSVSLGGIMVSTLAWNARDVGSILGTVFPIFITPMIFVSRLGCHSSLLLEGVHTLFTRAGEEQAYIKSGESVGK